MTRLTAEQRHELPDRDFAYIDREGNRHLPIENAEHVRDALSRWPRTEFESYEASQATRTRILDAARQFEIEVAPDDKVVQNRHD
jgi:hypothetical protein